MSGGALVEFHRTEIDSRGGWTDGGGDVGIETG